MPRLPACGEDGRGVTKAPAKFMKRASQDSADRQRLAELIEPIRVAMMTTVDDEGLLVSRPMVPLEIDEQGCIWFFTDLRSSKVEQLQRVNLSFVGSNDGDYVSLAGHGEIHNDRKRIDDLWSPMARPWFPEGPQSTNLALLKVTPHTAEFWDAPNSKMVRLFAMVASVATAQPIGMGEHGRLRVQRR